jgi:hypothetical protein
MHIDWLYLQYSRGTLRVERRTSVVFERHTWSRIPHIGGA